MIELVLNEQLARHTFSKQVGGLPAGTVNPLWDEVLELVVRGYTARVVGNVAIFTGAENFSFLTAARVTKICGDQAGQYQQNILGWACFAKVLIADLAQLVPTWFTDPYVPDPVTGMPTAQRKTLTEWGGPHRQSATHAYVEMNGGGAVEDGQTIARLVNAGYTVLSPDEARAELDEE